jgi:hypothetical protein
MTFLQALQYVMVRKWVENESTCRLFCADMYDYGVNMFRKIEHSCQDIFK